MKTFILIVVLALSFNSHSQDLAFTEWGDTIVAFEDGTWKKLSDIILVERAVKAEFADDEYLGGIEITLLSGKIKYFSLTKYTYQLEFLDEKGRPIKDYLISDDDGYTQKVNPLYMNKSLTMSYFNLPEHEQFGVIIEIVKLQIGL